MSEQEPTTPQPEGPDQPEPITTGGDEESEDEDESGSDR